MAIDEATWARWATVLPPEELEAGRAAAARQALGEKRLREFVASRLAKGEWAGNDDTRTFWQLVNGIDQPNPGERASRAAISARRVLEALHGAGIQAVITGDVAEGYGPHPEYGMEVLALGIDAQDGGRARVESIADSVSVVGLMVMCENDISARAVADILAGRHLAWDAEARCCVARN